MLLPNADDGTVLHCTVSGMRFMFFKQQIYCPVDSHVTTKVWRLSSAASM